MQEQDFDNQPDDGELLQIESGAEPAVPVNVVYPVRNQPLPTKAGAAKTIPCGTTQSTRVLVPDHRRAAAYLSVTAFPVLLSFEPITLGDATNAFPLAVGVLLGPLRMDTALYALGVGGTAQVGTLIEMWAAGDD